MRVLFDEMLDRRLKRYLPDGIGALTVRERGWGSLQNGKPFEAAQHGFDVLISTDRGIPHQQDLSRFALAVVILRANSNAVKDLSRLMGEISNALATARPGGVVRIEG